MTAAVFKCIKEDRSEELRKKECPEKYTSLNTEIFIQPSIVPIPPGDFFKLRYVVYNDIKQKASVTWLLFP